MSEFTLQEYRKIIKHHKHRVCDFYDSLKKNQWTILRHDVEFVPNRAFELAKIEKFYGVSASYVFQVRSNAYNIFSARNKHLIKNHHWYLKFLFLYKNNLTVHSSIINNIFVKV